MMVDDVGGEIGDDIDRCGDQHRRLDQRKVAKLYRIDEQAAEAGKGEDLLDDDHAADQVDEVEGERC